MVFREVSQAIHAPHSPDAQGGSARRTYTRHRPEQSLLYDVIRQELEPFLARAQAHEQPVPRFVEQEFRAFLRALFAELRRRARKHWEMRDPQCGAVTFIQRFGSALNLNLHFHTLALDGVYARDDSATASNPQRGTTTPRFRAGFHSTAA